MRYLVILFILSGCGYNNTKIPSDASTSANGGSNGAAATLDFATVKSQVFQNYCLRCHSAAGGNKAGVNLETYVRVKPIVQTILSEVNSGSMPPSGSLPTSARTLLANWIRNGAPEFVTASQGGPQNPTPTPAPTPCEQHHRLIEYGLIINLDRDFYFNVQMETINRRDDDCDDRTDDQLTTTLTEGI